jgi:hypothetical protein
MANITDPGGGGNYDDGDDGSSDSGGGGDDRTIRETLEESAGGRIPDAEPDPDPEPAPEPDPSPSPDPTPESGTTDGGADASDTSPTGVRDLVRDAVETQRENRRDTTSAERQQAAADQQDLREEVASQTDLSVGDIRTVDPQTGQGRLTGEARRESARDRFRETRQTTRRLSGLSGVDREDTVPLSQFDTDELDFQATADGVRVSPDPSALDAPTGETRTEQEAALRAELASQSDRIDADDVTIRQEDGRLVASAEPQTRQEEFWEPVTESVDAWLREQTGTGLPESEEAFLDDVADAGADAINTAIDLNNRNSVTGEPGVRTTTPALGDREAGLPEGTEEALDSPGTSRSRQGEFWQPVTESVDEFLREQTGSGLPDSEEEFLDPARGYAVEAAETAVELNDRFSIPEEDDGVETKIGTPPGALARGGSAVLAGRAARSGSSLRGAAAFLRRSGRASDAAAAGAGVGLGATALGAEGELDVPEERRQSELEISEPLGSGELEVSDSDVEELEISGRNTDELAVEDPTPPSELDVNSGGGATDDGTARRGEDTVVPGDYPLPGRDVPTDPTQESGPQTRPEDILDDTLGTAPAQQQGQQRQQEEDDPLDELLRDFEDTQQRRRRERARARERELGGAEEAISRRRQRQQRAQRLPLVNSGEDTFGFGREFPIGASSVIGREAARTEAAQQPQVGQEVGQGTRTGLLEGIGNALDVDVGQQPDVLQDQRAGQRTTQETGLGVDLEQDTALDNIFESPTVTEQTTEFVTPGATVTENVTESGPGAGGFGSRRGRRPRSPDGEDNDRDEEDFLLDEDAALFGSGISSGDELAEDVFGSGPTDDDVFDVDESEFL